MLLIVSKRKSEATTIADMIRYCGVICYPATPTEALSEMGTLYRAVVIIDPDTLPDPEDYVNRLRSYLSSIPIFAIYNRKHFEKLPFFDGSYSSAVYSSTFIEKISNYALNKKMTSIGDYRLAGINATPDRPTITFFEKPLDLTKTEAMILRFLMRSYPIPRKPRSIIKYIYKPSKAPEETSIRTLICTINKKFAVYIGRNLIRSVNGEGYVVYTPELQEKYRI